MGRRLVQARPHLHTDFSCLKLPGGQFLLCWARRKHPCVKTALNKTGYAWSVCAKKNACYRYPAAILQLVKNAKRAWMHARFVAPASHRHIRHFFESEAGDEDLVVIQVLTARIASVVRDTQIALRSTWRQVAFDARIFTMHT